MKKLLALTLCLALFTACEFTSIEDAVVETFEENLEETVSQEEAELIEDIIEETVEDVIEEALSVSELTFTDAEYGFSLIFPEIWTGYIATSFEDVEYTEGPGYYFGFDEEYADMIIAVSIHTHEEWTELQSFEGPKPTYLGENTNWVFAGSAGHEAPEAYMEHRMGYQDVFDSFEVL